MMRAAFAARFLQMDERAFSNDGYITDQRLTGGMMYGHFDSPTNGCGWIAVYNLYRYLSRGLTPEEVMEGMRAILPLRGIFGTPVRTELEYLKGGYAGAFRVTGKKKALEALRGRDCGIIRYIAVYEPHYVAFYRLGGDSFR